MMRLSLFFFAVLLVAAPSVRAAESEASDPEAEADCEDSDPEARNLLVKQFFQACGQFPEDGKCDLEDPAQEPSECGLGGIAGHIFDKERELICAGHPDCNAVVVDICLERGNKLQLRRKLVRCNPRAREKMVRFIKAMNRVRKEMKAMPPFGPETMTCVAGSGFWIDNLPSDRGPGGYFMRGPYRGAGFVCPFKPAAVSWEKHPNIPPHPCPKVKGSGLRCRNPEPGSSGFTR